MNTEQPVIPEDLQALYDDCTADDSRATCTTTSGFMCGLVERIARLTSDLAEVREDASQNTDRYLACEKRFEEAIAQRDAANLRVEGLEKERDEALAANELDRRSLHAVVRQIEEEITGRMWLIEGRGPYEWDDDKYRQEFGWAIHALQEKLEPLRKIAGDLKNCPTTEAGVNSVRALEAENAALTTRLEGLIRDNQASAAEVTELRQENSILKSEAAHIVGCRGHKLTESELATNMRKTVLSLCDVIDGWQKKCEELEARVEQLMNPITLTETLTHSRTCSAGYDLDADCICGLDYRIQLQTEQNLHAAWMKRAMEAEARVEQLSGPVTGERK